MSAFQQTKSIQVGLQFAQSITPVGRIAIKDHLIYFEYDPSFITSGLNISPLHLPLKSGVSTFDRHLFEGLPGVFNDSLPDGWGRLLLDRLVRSKGILPAQISPLDRLAYVGTHGMGALVYQPQHHYMATNEDISLDYLASQTIEVLEGGTNEVLEMLMDYNGSSAGARPKAMIEVDHTFQSIRHGTTDIHNDQYSAWMVKFANQQDGKDAGAIEYVYGLMAQSAGMEIPNIHLFPSQYTSGYFACQRFDRKNKQRLHLHSAAGLLHCDFRVPSLDYSDLVALTWHITQDIREVEKLYRLAVFNVLAHNRDDHAKNFSYLMNQKGTWKLSPAYDLTFSSGPNGEQSTMVMGEGKNPSVNHLKALGKDANIPPKKVDDIIAQTKEALSQWQQLAQQYGVTPEQIKIIQKKINP